MKEFLINLLFAITIAAIPVVSTYTVKYLQALKKRAQGSIDSETIQAVLDLILQVVTSVSQTYVDNLKAEGLFDEDQQLFVFNLAKDTVLELLDANSKNLIVAMYSDLDTWLDVQIEAAVRTLKSN